MNQQETAHSPSRWFSHGSAESIITNLPWPDVAQRIPCCRFPSPGPSEISDIDDEINAIFNSPEFSEVVGCLRLAAGEYLKNLGADIKAR
jgi:hypothetical protein